MAKKKLVVLTGAGISADSGLKTFRDSNGLWNGYDVYEVASPRGWQKNPQLVLDFYNSRRREIAKAEPNNGHIGLAKLESIFDVQIITQNIDDLHERAGSSSVLHLHGEIFKMRSAANTNLVYEIREDIRLGDKASDGIQLRPYIVWFEEPVPLIENAIEIAQTADIFVVIGTSLQVYPATSLIQFIRHEIPVYIIDKKIPTISNSTNLFRIEKPASEGIHDLSLLLKCIQ